jgi:pSer/pThr/pTyr-binding forkhead associated (FHA) protein
LRVTADGAFLRDLGSRNGTLVNGTRLMKERDLQDGDQLQVGPLLFEVQLEDSVDIPPTLPPQAQDSVPERPAVAETAIRALDTDEIKVINRPPAPAREQSPGESPTTSELPAVQPR